MTTDEKVALTAPCGLDCFNCQLYEAHITDAMRAEVAARRHLPLDQAACKGCRAQRGWDNSCATYRCVAEHSVAFCFECDEFPCRLLAPSRDGADRFPHNFKVFNLCRMKSIGVERWAEEEAHLVRRRYYEGTFKPGDGPRLPEDGDDSR